MSAQSQAAAAVRRPTETCRLCKRCRRIQRGSGRRSGDGACGVYYHYDRGRVSTRTWRGVVWQRPWP
eukprot:6771712-Pyramimonas_sp.AAC.1